MDAVDEYFKSEKEMLKSFGYEGKMIAQICDMRGYSWHIEGGRVFRNREPYTYQDYLDGNLCLLVGNLNGVIMADSNAVHRNELYTLIATTTDDNWHAALLLFQNDKEMRWAS